MKDVVQTFNGVNIILIEKATNEVKLFFSPVQPKTIRVNKNTWHKFLPLNKDDYIYEKSEIATKTIISPFEEIYNKCN